MAKLTTINDPLKEEATPLGVLVNEEMFGLAPADRIGLMLVFGRSGQGKTVNLVVQAVSDIVHGRGGILIDPYGDIIEEVKKYIPAEQKDKVATFEVTKGNLEDNVKRFEQEIHLGEMKADSQKFLLCNLSYTLIGPHAARDFGLYLLNEFYKQVGGDGDMSNRALYIDEAHNFIDEESLPHILKSKEYKLPCVLSDQSLNYFSEDLMDQLLGATDHLVCYNVNKRTAKLLAEKMKLGVSAEDLQAIEKYKF
ncbi:hypothetical protein ACFL2M_02075, partial [Patescibacteria group bacterium]